MSSYGCACDRPYIFIRNSFIFFSLSPSPSIYTSISCFHSLSFCIFSYFLLSHWLFLTHPRYLRSLSAFECTHRDVFALDFIRGTHMLACGSRDGLVRIWDTRTHQTAMCTLPDSCSRRGGKCSKHVIIVPRSSHHDFASLRRRQLPQKAQSARSPPFQMGCLYSQPTPMVVSVYGTGAQDGVRETLVLSQPLDFGRRSNMTCSLIHLCAEIIMREGY